MGEGWWARGRGRVLRWIWIWGWGCERFRLRLGRLLRVLFCGGRLGAIGGAFFGGGLRFWFLWGWGLGGFGVWSGGGG